MSETCPLEGCGYQGSEHGLKVHYGRSLDHPGSLSDNYYNCVVCGDEAYNRDGRKSARCCSYICSAVDRSNFDTLSDYWFARVDVCDYCGDVFEHTPSKSRRFCSEECTTENRKSTGNFVKKSNPRWVGRVSVECPHCEDDFEVRPSEVDKRIYCSFSCRSKEIGKRNKLEPELSKCREQIPIPNDVRVEIYRRDNNQCLMCGMSQEDHLSLYNQRLDIHHIIPRVQFVVECSSVEEARREANRSSNLESLCKSCHSVKEFDDNPYMSREVATGV